ncbi:NUDIX domain-containing protein [Rossellomorea sp. RS05]|uniref:NUDIX hydrolase n=1 Tax=Rossellomorea sp. RS05 TaxID=3149166 RepID=UPI003221B052
MGREKGRVEPIKKAYGYITRNHNGRPQVLVFQHPILEAGVQIPKGTVQDGEDPEAAVVREMIEETGLTEWGKPVFLADDRWRADDGSIHHRHFYRLDQGDAPDQWQHEPSGGGEEEGLQFTLFWISSPGDIPLARGHGDYLADVLEERPEDGLRCLEASEDFKQVYMIEEGMERIIGETRERISFEEDGAVLVREQTLTSEEIGDRRTVTRLMASTNRPLSVEDSGGGMRAVYAGDHVIIEREGGERRISLHHVPVDTFSVELLLRTLPLEGGYVRSFHAFNVLKEEEQLIEIHADEQASGSFKVRVEFGTTTQWYWIRSDTREVMKQYSEPAPGLQVEFRR